MLHADVGSPSGLASIPDCLGDDGNDCCSSDELLTGGVEPLLGLASPPVCGPSGGVLLAEIFS